MTNQEAAEMIRNDMKLHHDYLSGEYRKALKIAISALQTQDSKTRSCDTCKHNPVSKKWPCVDCDMREPADRWEPQEVKNLTQEAKILTQNGLDTISRQAAIDTEGLDEEIRCEMCRNPMHTDRGCDGNCKYDEKLYEKIMQILDKRIKQLPSTQPEPLTEAEVIICKMYLDDLDKHKTCNEYKLLMGLLDGTASAQPEQKWIPCKTGILPEKRDEFYQATYLLDDGDRMVDYVYFNSKGEWSNYAYEYSELLAWMPLPEAYKGDK